MLRHLAALSLLAVFVAGCLPAISATPGPSSSDRAPGQSAIAANEPRPIVIDADLDHSDLAAIMVLLRDPRVDVRAIAVDGTGLVHCQGGLRVMRYLLDELGRSDIPFGCGRQRGGDDATPFPDDWRATADAGYGLAIAPRVETAFPPDAVSVIRDAIDSSPTPVTIVALGPLTNLEDAFAADPTLADRIESIHAMLGTIDAPGNVFLGGHDGSDPLEWNAFADPSAVQAVFATDVPIDLIPLDATDDVPVPADLAERLAADHAAGAADLMYELLLRNPSRDGDRPGPAAVGRARRADRQRSEARQLGRCDRHRWDRRPIDPRSGGPADPSCLGGGRAGRGGWPARSASAGRSAGDPVRSGRDHRGHLGWPECRSVTDGSGVGLHTLRYQGPPGVASGVLVGGVRAPHTWSDLVDFITTVDVSSEVDSPDWLIDGGQAYDETGTGQPITSTVNLSGAESGPVCVTGAWPDLIFMPGDAFEARP